MTSTTASCCIIATDNTTPRHVHSLEGSLCWLWLLRA